MAPLTPSIPPRHAVILLSGGLDSATVLALAHASGTICHTLAIDYGQRHRHELSAARAIATHFKIADHREVALDLREIGGSALTADIPVPKEGPRNQGTKGSRGSPPLDPLAPRSPDSSPIPITYVPARNMVFISIAVGLAEAVGASEIHLGVNSVDYSGYPDCRPDFIAAMQTTIALGTKAGVEGHAPQLVTPLLHMTKAQIIHAGTKLGLNYALTHSCYDPIIRNNQTLSCGRCDSCLIRRQGFINANVTDPTRYAT